MVFFFISTRTFDLNKRKEIYVKYHLIIYSLRDQWIVIVLTN